MNTLKYVIKTKVDENEMIHNRQLLKFLVLNICSGQVYMDHLRALQYNLPALVLVL